jgi:PDZ domain/Aspartyl protease
MKRHTLLAGLVLLAAAFVARAESPKPDEVKKKADFKPVTVPFELFKTKHIAIMVKINGKGPYRMIFDTGAPISLVSNKVANENKLVDKNAPQPLFNPFGAQGEAKIKSLEVGDLKIENTSAMVMDHPAVEAMSKAFGPVEGIVGFPVFARFKMTLDYQALTMTFAPGDYDPPDTMKALTATIMAMGNNQGPKILSPAGQWGMVLAKAASDKEPGVTVKEVLPDGAAASAGLQAGDRLLTLDDRWTDSLADAYLAAGFVKPGTSVKVVVKRNGKEVELNVKPAPGL